MKSARSIFILLALVLATTAFAQSAVFRSVMPDGKIVYGSKPEPGAKESKAVNLPPPNIAAPTPASTGSAEAPAATGRNNADANAAQARLEAAQRALEAGREPLPGERTGIATKGGSPRTQLNETYYQRIKGLEDAVSAAQQELNAAQSAAR